MTSISIFPTNIPAIWLTVAHKINAGNDYARNSQKWHLLNLCLPYKNCRLFANDSYCSSVILYMPMWKIIHTCSGIFNEPVNAGMDNAGKSRSGIYDVYFCLP